MRARTFAEDVNEPDAPGASTDAASDAPTYEFAGFTVEVSEKLALMPPSPPRRAKDSP